MTGQDLYSDDVGEGQSTGSRDPDFAERLKRDGRERLESGKSSAAGRIEAIANAIDGTAERLQEQDPTLAQYAGRLAQGIGGIANRLREGNLEELVAQTRQLAARQPTLFLAGGFILGLALARFLKVSTTDSYEDDFAAAAAAQDFQGSGDGRREFE